MGRQYSLEEKERAIQLFQILGHYTWVIAELGYPSRTMLHYWIKEYRRTGNIEVTNKTRRKFSVEHRKHAVEYYLSHGRSIKNTITALEYPGATLLGEWLREDLPKEQRKWSCKFNGHAIKYTTEQKAEIVQKYCSGQTPSQISKESLYNAYLNFDDNFDDQYITEYSGEWFKPINVGREKDGGYKYGGLWGAQSILTDFKEYMKDGGDGEQRINYTAETYKLKKANLIDVLGLCPIRYSFNPESPASVYENVVGKKKVLEQFKNKGIEIYTEGFSYAMADSLTSVHHFPTEYGETPIFGGIEVPVSTITYRETLNYGGFSLGNENPGYFLKYNRMRVANQWGDQENQVTSEYYLFTLPYKVLSGETVIDFNISEDGEYWNYILTNNSSIKAPSNDHNTNGYNAFYKGNQIIGSEDGGWSVCPMDDSRIAFYAMNDRILSYKLPEGQTADTIFAKALMSDNQVAYRAVNRKGQITANK